MNAASGISHAGGFEPLPAGLDPRTITDDLLRAHGLPRRPDPVLEPQLLRQWNRIMARPTHLVRAELEVDPVMTARHGHRADPGQIWGGVVREMTPGTDYAHPATMIFAEWVVPEVLSVAPEGPDLTVAFWIGLDGYQGEGAQVLQAGVAATVSPGWFSSSVEYWAWTEWYTGEYMTPAVRVTNFQVAPGDNVSFLVTVAGPASGLAFMRNSRTGIGTSAWIQAPQGVVSSEHDCRLGHGGGLGILARFRADHFHELLGLTRSSRARANISALSPEPSRRGSWASRLAARWVRT